jgi:hypothetical protein
MTAPPALLGQMDARIAAWEPVGDRRFVFLKCYRMMTGNVLEAIGNHEFQHPEWVRALLHRFAEYYFEALERYERGDDATPAVWKHVFEQTTSGRLSVLQQLFLGVNAHISYDLVLALEEMLRPHWKQCAEPEKRTYHADHRHINEVIYRTIDAVQDEVVEKVSPLLDVVDKLMGRLDERLIAGLIAGWRDEVWVHSSALLDAADPGARRQLLLELEEKVMEKSRRIVRGFF